MSVTLVAQLLGIAAASGTRASLTLAILAVMARFGGWELPGELAFLSSDIGLGILAALLVLDELVERDPDLQQAMVLVNVGVRGAAGAVAAWGLEDALGDTLPDPAVWAIGAAVAVGVHLLRARVQEHLPDAGDGWLNPRTWLGWLEVGGVVGIVTAVFLAPFLALAFVIVASVAGVGVLLVARGIERTRYRRRCPHCGHAARVEASRCPGCRGPLEVTRWLRSP